MLVNFEADMVVLMRWQYLEADFSDLVLWSCWSAAVENRTDLSRTGALINVAADLWQC